MTKARMLLIASLLASMAPSAPLAAATGEYSITGYIPTQGGAWDYAVIDPKAGRLYLAQAGVTAIDLKTQRVTLGLVTAKGSHGLALLGNGAVVVDDSQAKTITVFDGASGKILSVISTVDRNPVDGPHALDALVLEPRTGLLAALNGESGLLLLVDLQQSRVVGTVTVGGHPEFAAADGTGKLLININHGKTSEIVAVDVASRAVTRHIPMRGCEEATGMAFDEATHLVLSVCGNGLLKVIDESAGRVVASVAVGEGADAVMFDPKRRRAFVAGAESGTLSVVAVRSAGDVALIQTLAVPKGTRLGAVDVDTGCLYLPTAKFGPPKPPIPYPSVRPGTFEFLIVAPG